MKPLTFALASLVLIVAGCSGGGGNASAPGSPEVDMKQPEAAKGNTGVPDGGGMAAVDFEKDVKPVMAEYCVGCHSGPKPADDLDMSKIATNDDAKAAGAQFSKMAQMVEGGKMPPAKGKPLPDDVKAKLVEHLKALGS